jgi:hypothetical protein
MQSENAAVSARLILYFKPPKIPQEPTSTTDAALSERDAALGSTRRRQRSVFRLCRGNFGTRISAAPRSRQQAW